MHRYSILKIELGKDVNVGKGDSVFVLILLNIFLGAVNAIRCGERFMLKSLWLGGALSQPNVFAPTGSIRRLSRKKLFFFFFKLFGWRWRRDWRGERLGRGNQVGGWGHSPGAHGAPADPAGFAWIADEGSWSPGEMSPMLMHLPPPDNPYRRLAMHRVWIFLASLSSLTSGIIPRQSSAGANTESLNMSSRGNGACVHDRLIPGRASSNRRGGKDGNSGCPVGARLSFGNKPFST